MRELYTLSELGREACLVTFIGARTMLALSDPMADI